MSRICHLPTKALAWELWHTLLFIFYFLVSVWICTKLTLISTLPRVHQVSDAKIPLYVVQDQGRAVFARPPATSSATARTLVTARRKKKATQISQPAFWFNIRIAS